MPYVKWKNARISEYKKIPKMKIGLKRRNLLTIQHLINFKGPWNKLQGFWVITGKQIVDNNEVEKSPLKKDQKQKKIMT